DVAAVAQQLVIVHPVLFRFAGFGGNVDVIAVRVLFVGFNEDFLGIVLGAWFRCLQIMVLHVFAIVDERMLETIKQAEIENEAFFPEGFLQAFQRIMHNTVADAQMSGSWGTLHFEIVQPAEQRIGLLDLVGRLIRKNQNALLVQFKRIHCYFPRRMLIPFNRFSA
ncbi:MAG: hypothetical protein PHP05_06315, partial [Sideroxydans sp.]|nr:hypothetical protein [Sideroxydans sp.]